MSAKTCPSRSMSTILDRILPTGLRVYTRTVSYIPRSLVPFESSHEVLSPKPELPPATAYDPPAPPSNRDLGPPPPGYGRYADFDGGFRGGGPGGVGRGGPQEGGPRRNLDEVLCFKVRASNGG
jgi:hypothetical protein